MPHNMIILYFHLPYFYVSNSALFFKIILIDVVLQLSITCTEIEYNERTFLNLAEAVSGLTNLLVGHNGELHISMLSSLV